MTELRSHALPVRARDVPFAFESVPRTWFRGNVWATHYFNALNLLFPEGERFFVRSVAHYQKRIEDPALRERIRGFIGQEVTHGTAHERYFATLRGHGYPVDRMLDAYVEESRAGEASIPARFRLSLTVAAEHFTATLADPVVRRPELLAGVHPEMRKLMIWHAAEEIEHKDVAFDVLARVHPSYRLRMAGFMSFATFLTTITRRWARLLFRVDGLSAAEIRRARAEVREWNVEHVLGTRLIWTAFRSYVQPSFHPSRYENGGAAQAALVSLGLPPAQAVPA